MFRQIPRRDERLIVHGHLHTFFAVVRRDYLAKKSVIQAGTLMWLMSEIIYAEAKGEPLNITLLARAMQVERSTVRRWILTLEADGQVMRNGEDLHLDRRMLNSAAANRALDEIVDMMINNGRALERVRRR